jgi:hypothetical protein
LFLLLAAVPAAADGSGDAVARGALYDYYRTLRPNQPGIESVRDRLVPVMQKLSPKVGKSCRNVIRRGFDKKYKKDLAYLRCLCEILAAGGKPGINILYKQYKKSKKDVPLCRAMAEVFGACGDERALDPLLKMMYDKRPSVAAVAVTGCASYAGIKQDKRKAAVKKMVERYTKVYDDAAGKEPHTVQAQMYQALKPTMNATLRAFTGQELDSTLRAFTGQELDSAAAWKAWLGENLSQNWDG